MWTEILTILGIAFFISLPVLSILGILLMYSEKTLTTKAIVSIILTISSSSFFIIFMFLIKIILILDKG
jgi:hypothetical protein